MKNNVKYLVTGAAGFLGGTICRQLIKRGHSVRAFVFPGAPAIRYVSGETEIVKGDLTDLPSLEKLFQAEEGTGNVVLHIAGTVTVCGQFPEPHVGLYVRLLFQRFITAAVPRAVQPVHNNI